MKTNPANDEKVKMSNIFQQESLDVNLLADMSLGFSLLLACLFYLTWRRHAQILEVSNQLRKRVDLFSENH